MENATRWYISKMRPTDPGYDTYASKTWPWMLYLGRPSTTIGRRYAGVKFRTHGDVIAYISEPNAVEKFHRYRGSVNYRRTSL